MARSLNPVHRAQQNHQEWSGTDQVVNYQEQS